jgi:ABC-type nitrate/sulfonate/bicarbonate transport system substrate-binding protein
MAMPRSGFIKLAGCASLGGFASSTGIASGEDVRTVRVLEVPTDGAKSVLYAQQANIFRKHGISADIVPLGSGAAIFAAVLGGAADFGSGSTGQDAALLKRSVRSITATMVTMAELQRPLDFGYKCGTIEPHIDLRGLLAPSVPLARA